MPGRSDYRAVSIELIELSKVLNDLSLTREQLVDLCLLMGTDYNTGVSGIGPKKALKLIRENMNVETSLKSIGTFIPRVEELRRLFLEYEKTDDYRLDWRPPDKEKVIEFLCEEHSFSPSRVEGALTKIEEKYASEHAKTHTQIKLDFF
jgi:flap endonuclease-1